MGFKKYLPEFLLSLSPLTTIPTRYFTLAVTYDNTVHMYITYYMALQNFYFIIDLQMV